MRVTASAALLAIAMVGAAVAADFGDHTGFASASQTASADIRIGAAASDDEAVNPSTGTANADDTTGTDDEDVMMPSFTEGSATSLTVPVTINTAGLSGATSRVRVFVDWNGDGDVADTNETLASQTAAANGLNTLSFSLLPPAGTTAGTKYLRVRATEGSTAPTFSGGSALKGEVEDYAITVNAAGTSDFGDWNGAGALTTTTSSTMNTNLRLGATVDAEASVTPDAGATADGADEDGVSVLPVMTQGGWGWLGVYVTNSSGANGYLNAWIDFDNDGDFADTGEQTVTNITIATGTANAFQSYAFPVTMTAVTGTNLGMRLRLTSTSAPGPTGASGTGEVEDYVVSVIAPNTPAVGEWLLTDHGPFGSGNPRGSPLIWRVPSTGGTSATSTPPAGMTVWSTAVPEPLGICHLNGLYYVTDHPQGDMTTKRSSVVEVAPNGVPTGKRWTLGSAIASVPDGWDIVADGTYLYVALLTENINGAAGIYRIDPSAYATGENYIATPWSPLRPFGTWRGPNGLALGRGTQAGNLLAAVQISNTQNSVYVIPLATGAVPGSALFTENASADGASYAGIRDIDTDAAGNIYVAQASGGVLRKYTSAGVLSDGSWMSIGAAFNFNPTGTAWGADGNQYLVGYEDGDIWRHGNSTGGQTQWLNWLGANTSPSMSKAKYLLQVPANDYGDYPSFPFASQIASADIRIGTIATDGEAANPTTGSATVDDTTATDDEDVTMPAFTVGSATSLTVPVTINTAGLSGATSRVRVFVDWNGDGDVADTNETLAAQTAGTNGLNNLSFSLLPPAGTTAGTKYLRIRATEGSTAPTFAGASALKGEVEDYPVTVNAAANDFGDLADTAAGTSAGNYETLLANNGPRHTIVSNTQRLGATVDAEADGQPNSGATGDGADDDGVTIPALTVGQFAALTVNANVAGYLNAWIDWNNDGDFADSFETLVTDRALSAGNNTLVVNVPWSAATGVNLGARFRFTTGTGQATTPYGLAANGEVEDYAIQVSACPVSCMFVSSYDQNQVVHFNGAAGNPATGTFGSANLLNAYDMVLGPDGMLYVVSNGDDKVVKFNPATGAYVSDFVTAGSGGLDQPTGVTFGPDGNLYVAGFASQAVHKYNGTTGASMGKFVNDLSTYPIQGLEFGPDGHLYVADNGTGFVRKYNGTTGAYMFSFSQASGWMQDITFGPDGLLYLAEQDQNRITRWNPATGAFVNVWFYHSEPFGWIDTRITGMSFGPDGNFYLAHWYPTGGVTKHHGTTGVSMGEFATVVSPKDVVFMCGACPASLAEFGDWNGSGAATTTTTSIVNSNLRLGATVDAEASVTPNAGATADGADEDGVTVPGSITAGTVGLSIPISVFNNTGANAYVDAWIDFDNSGTFSNTVATTAGTGERSKTQLTIASSASVQSVNVVFDVPSAASVGSQRGVRFRVSNSNAHTPTSTGATGEIEDYVVTLGAAASLDFGDATGYPAATATQTVGTPKFGALVDYEASQPADDNTTGADEDGVYVATQALQGRYLYVNYDANTTAASFTNIWVDWNRDNDFADVGEQVATNISHATRTTGTLKIPVPATASPGASWLRARISSASGAAPTGATADGEVEDHAVTIVDSVTISGVIFEDTNNNGQRDAGEPGIAGVPLQLEGNYDDMAFSDATGAYSLITGPGSSYVRLNFLDTNGYTLSPKDVGSDATDSDFTTAVLSVADSSSFTFTAASADVVNLSAGLVPVANARTYFHAGIRQTDNWSTTITLPKFSVPNATLLETRRIAVVTPSSDLYIENQAGSSASISAAGTMTLSSSYPNAPVLTTSDSRPYPNPVVSLAANDGNYAFNPAAGLTAIGGYNGAPLDGFGASAITGVFPSYIGAPGDTISVPVTMAHSYVWSGGSTYASKIVQDTIVAHAVTYLYATTDFGDWNGAGALTTTTSSTMNTNLRLGPTVDAEASVIPNAAATADGADEDGVTMPSSITQGASVTIPVSVFNNNTSGKYLQAWIDFNNDGTFNNTDVTSGGERIYNAATTASASQQTVNVTFTVPAGASVGTQRGVRFRLSDNAATTPTSSGATGEIEDYVVSIAAPVTCPPAIAHTTWAYSQVHNRLFQVSGFDNATLTLTDYGRLRYNGTILDVVGGDTTVEAMAINNNTGRAYFVSNTALGAFAAPVLFYVDLGTLSAGTANLIDITAVATMSGVTECEAMAFDAGSTLLYGNNHVSSGNDFLVVINTTTGAATSLGKMTGAGFTANTVKAMEFDAAGNLYVGDEIQGDLFRVNKVNGAILAREDDNITNGVQSMLWDPAGQRMIAFNSSGATCFQITLGSNGANPDLANFPAPAAGPNIGTAFDFSAVDNVGDAANDWGDLAGFTNASSITDACLRIGATVDAEGTAITNVGATGDGADEDGVTMPASIAPGASVTIPVAVFNSTGANGYLNAWIDFNGDGVFNDTLVTSGGERLEAARLIPTGTGTATPQSITFTVPVGASVGTQRGVRFRLTNQAVTAPTAAVGSGEVEDYVVTISSSLSLGNLVWSDTNNNGIKEAGENGIDGVTVQLWTPGADNSIGGSDDALASTVTTAGGGLYSFTGLAAGKYFVRIPTPPASAPISSAGTDMADNGQDDDDNGHQISSGATYSPVITLAASTEPGSGGATNTDNTIDFGFLPGTPCVFTTANYDDAIDLLDATTGRWAGQFSAPFGNTNNQGNSTGDEPYGIEYGPDGKYYIARYGASNIMAYSSAGASLGDVLTNTPGVSNLPWFTFGPDGHYYVVDENNNRIVRFYGPLSATPGQPIGSAPYTFISAADPYDIGFGPDNNIYVGTANSIKRYNAVTGAFMNDIVTEAQVAAMVAGGSGTSLIGFFDIHGNTLYGFNDNDDEVYKIDLTNPAAPGAPVFIADLSSAGQGTISSRDLEVHPVTGDIYLAAFYWAKPVAAGGAIGSTAMIKITQAGAVTFYEVPAASPPGPADMFSWAGAKDINFAPCILPGNQFTSIGSLVWGDTNNNGTRDAGEPGISGVKVELWRDADLNGTAETLIGWMLTTADGYYHFAGQAVGTYQIKIPASNFGAGQPLAARNRTSGTPVNSDNQTDNDNNGVQAGGPGTAVSSPLIVLMVAGEPTAAETGPGGDLDTMLGDNSGDMTVDFGFSTPPGAQCAIVAAYWDNTIYTFSAAGGTPDGGFPTAGSGLNGPYGMKQGPDGNVYITSSANNSVKRFNISTGLFMGDFIAPNSGGLNYPQGLAWGPDGNLYVGSYTNVKRYNGTTGAYISDFTSSTIAATPSYYNTHQGIVFGPDGNLYVGDFNGGRILKFNGTTGAFISVFTTLAADAYPKGMGFGADGHLYVVQSGLDTVLKINGTTGASMGVFATLPPGSSLTGMTWNTTDGNLYVNGIDGNVYRVNGTTGVNMGPWAIVGNGGAKDIIFTNQICPPAGNLGVGNYIFVDANGNNLHDSGEDPPASVIVQIFRQGDNPQIALPLETRQSSSSGNYLFSGLAPGSYFLHIPASQFLAGGPLNGYDSVTGNGSDNGTDNNDDGIDAANPAATGVSSVVFALAVNSEPVDTGTETGIYANQDINDDNNIDLTIDLGFKLAAPTVSVGNRVWIDTNGNGSFEFASGELPLDGLRMNLYRDVDASGTLGAGDGAPLATQHTSNGGYYRFNGLIDGNYIVEVAASNFTAGGILEGFTTTTGSADPDNNTDSDDNGTAVAGFGVASAAITLTTGAEPVTDGDTDANSNLTVDFGFNCVGSLLVESYIINHTSDKVNKHSWSAGTYLSDIVSAGSGGLQRPYEMALGTNGDLFVTSSFDHKVVRYNGRTGALVGTFIPASSGGLNTPSGITFGPDGHCYVASRYTNEIKRYNGSTGAYIDTFISTGLNQPFQGLLWSADNKLYVGNYASGEIRRHSLSGAFLDSISLPGGVLTVRGFSFGPDGNLYVAAHNNIIYKVTTGAAMTVSTFATGPSEAYAHAIFGPDGHLYATDLMNGRVRKFNGSTGADLGIYTSAGALGEPKETLFYPRCGPPPGLNDFGDYAPFGAASSSVSANLKLGSVVDADAAPATNIAAIADDSNANPNDEDGVTLPPILNIGGTESVAIRATNTTGATAYLNAWIDFNRDGTLDASERVINDASISNGTNNVSQNYSFTVPAGAVAGPTAIRVRLTSTSNPGATGTSGNGEVEDHTTMLACATLRLSAAQLQTAPDQAEGAPFSWNNISGSGVNMSLTWADVDAGIASHGFQGYAGDGAHTTGGLWIGDATSGSSGDSRFTFTFSQPVSEVVVHFNYLSNDTENEQLINWATAGGTGGAVTYQFAEAGSHPLGPDHTTVLPARVYWDGTKVVPELTVNDGHGTIRVTSTGTFTTFAFTLDAIAGINQGFIIDEITACTAAAPSMDFGDYASFASASSTVNPAIKLGLVVDGEAAATTNATATGDDITGSDDEDGALIPSMIAGAVPSLHAGTNPVVSIRTHNTTGANAFLNAWMDFNRNGAFDAGEQIITNYTVSTGRDATDFDDNTASFSFQFNLPSTATAGTSGLRFRFNTASGAPATGAFGTGEVEDYVVNVMAPCTNLLTNGNFESGVAAQPNPKKDGDANTTLTPIPGWTFTQLTGSGGAYTVDGFDNRPAMADGMHEAWIAGGSSAVVGSTSTSHMYQDIAAVPGAIYDLRYAASMHDPLDNIGEVRIQYLDATNAPIAGYPMLSNRITHDAELYWPFTSFAPDSLSLPAAPATAAKVRVSIFNSRAAGTPWDASKVSDMCLTTPSPTNDFGDWNGSGALTTTTSSSVNPSLRIGTTVDAEASVTPNTAATADDTTGSDDEDGVTMPASIAAGTIVTIPLSVLNNTGSSAYLSAWIDFNNDGTFDNTLVTSGGEKVYSNTIASGATAQAVNVSFTVPAGASVGAARGVRFRLTDVAATPPTGAVGNGEVEDYVVAITPAPAPAACKLYVTDYGGLGGSDDALYKFEPTTGVFASTIAAPVVGAFDALHTWDIDAFNGMLYVATDTGGSVLKYDLSGAYQGVHVPSGASYSLLAGGTSTVTNVQFSEFDAAGNFYLVLGSASIVRFDAAGLNGTEVVRIGWGTGGICIDPINGDIYALVTAPNGLGANGGVYRFSSAGVLLDFNNLSTNFDGGTGGWNISGTFGMTIHAGKIYFTHQGTSIAKRGVIELAYNKVGGGASYTAIWNTNFRMFARNDLMDDPRDLDFSPDDGHLYVVNHQGGQSLIYKFNGTTGALISAFGNPTPPSGTSLKGLAFGCPPTNDFGDWNGLGAQTTTTSSIFVPNLRLGATIDAEASVVPNAAATADGADEDGVAMPARITVGSSVTLPVSVYNSAGAARYLHAWIDFNNDGSFNDALVAGGGERLEPVRTINTSGVIQAVNVTFTVPAGASLGAQRGVRVRLSDRNVLTATMSGDLGEIEDYVVEIASQLALGNLVFLDANGNGHYDTGEGRDGVTVQLFSSAQTPGVDAPLQTKVTSGGGRYLFDGLLPGFYRVHVPAAMFVTGAPLQSTISIAEGLAGDDDVGEDGINSLSPHLTGISSGVVSIALGSAPTDLNGETGVDNTSDNAFDAAIDLTVDFGFANPLGVGNLVFRDQNGNGRADTGEGVGSVTVELYRANDTPGLALPVATTETDASGHYLFDYLMAGSYYVFIPAAEFATGGQLVGLVSMTGAGVAVADDNADENGQDVLSPQATGVRSAAFELANNAEPTDAAGEGGYLATEDSRDDNNYDLTIDLGFAAPDASKVGLGNLVFLDANGNSVFDPAEGVAGVVLRLFAEGVNPSSGTPVASTVSTAGGFYSFGGLSPGRYFVHVPASEFGTGRPLSGKLSIPGAGGDTGQDDNLDENGVDAATPATSGVSSGVVQLALGDEPTDLDSEVGEGFYNDVLDSNSDLTVDFGFYVPAAVGNLVFRDLNANGHADSGEGVAGTRVEIYPQGQLPGFDAPFAHVITDSMGRYRLEGLPPGGYLLHVPPSEFALGKPLYGAVSMTGVQAGDDNEGEDGIDEAVPTVFGVSTGVVMLSSGGAPAGTAEGGLFGTDDDARDTAVDLTVDFGFTQPPPKAISGRVRYDVDGDGDVAEEGDLPLRSVEVALYLDVNGDYAPDEGDELLATAVTGQDGRFAFPDLTEGNYLLVETDPPGATSTADSFDINDNVIALYLGEADITDNDFLDVIEPQGYVYDPATGGLVSGGTISVEGPGEVRVLLDGSAGVYAWVKTPEAAGLYTLSYNPRAGREMDATRPPQVTAFDPTGLEPPVAIGSGLNIVGTALANFSAAANPWHASFDLAPEDPVVTRNNLPVVEMSAGTWAGWQYQNPLGGQNGPGQNPDGDAQDNLQEFAFALDPASGLAGGKRPLELRRNAQSGAIEARVRRAAGLSGVTLTLEGIADLAGSPGGWFPVTSLAPVVSSNADGSETLLYSDLATVPGLTEGRGFVRVKVELGTPAATTRTGVCGWSTRVFERSLQTFGAPFMSAAQFSGTVAGVSGPGAAPSVSIGSASVGAGGSIAGAMSAGKAYFLEIVSGVHAGQRLEVDEAGSTATTVALDAASTLNTLGVGQLPATLAGARAELREHGTIGAAFDPVRFNSTTSPSTADRVLLFNRTSNTYTTYWLFRNSGAPKWVRNGDATLADAGGRVLAPGEGVLVQAKYAVLSTVYTGEVRSWAFASPLGAGTQMMGNPWPVGQSPAQRVMNSGSGFKGASLASSADQVRLWLGDSVAGQQGYTTYYYFKTGTYDQWTRQGDATLANQGASVLFKAQGAAFIRSVLGNPTWVIPCPWTP